MRRILLIVVLVFILSLIPAMASAQSTMVIDELYVRFWPEYDKPAMLVIYDIILAEDVELPAIFSIRIPAAAGEPPAVWTPGIGEGNAEYQREVEGEWAWITFEVPFEPEIRLEYYDPGLEFDGLTRAFTYTWPADFQVNRFIAEVQQPFDASNMQLSEPAIIGTDGHGLTIHQMNLGAIPAGERVELSIAYQKASETLFKEMVSADQLPNQTEEGTSTLPGWVPYLAVGVILIIAVGLWMYRGNSLGSRSRRSRRRRPGSRRRRAKPSRTTLSGKPAHFCHECGSQAIKGDKFCRECGAKIRV